MDDIFKDVEEMVLQVIAGEIAESDVSDPRCGFDDELPLFVIAFALHRLANAWERRVEIAEATAKQKGINP